MKIWMNRSPRWLVFLSVGMALALSACSATANKPTEFKFTAPQNGAQINVGQSVPIQAMVTGEAISRVDVLINSELYAKLEAPDKSRGAQNFPVAVPWTPKNVGTYAVQLQAYGTDDKKLADSELVLVNAKPLGQAAAPTVALNTPADSNSPAPASGQPAPQPVAGQPTAQPKPTSAPTAAPANDPVVTVTNDFVNVRKSADATSDLLGKLNKGDKATVRARSQDGQWWQIAFNNTSGWVFADYVDANDVAKTIKPGATFSKGTGGVTAPPAVGAKGILKLSANPIPTNGSVTVSWKVENAREVVFDIGDGQGFKAAGGEMNIEVKNVASGRTFRLRVSDNNGQIIEDSVSVTVQ